MVRRLLSLSVWSVALLWLVLWSNHIVILAGCKIIRIPMFFFWFLIVMCRWAQGPSCSGGMFCSDKAGVFNVVYVCTSRRVNLQSMGD